MKILKQENVISTLNNYLAQYETDHIINETFDVCEAQLDKIH